jgi:hypothetical protein
VNFIFKPFNLIAWGYFMGRKAVDKWANRQYTFVKTWIIIALIEGIDLILAIMK